jgi:Protein of unknown function (DUF2846)
MKTLLAIVLFAIATPLIAQAQVTIPPAGPQAEPTGPQASAGCGSLKEDWDVTTNDKNHPTAVAEPTRAHVYFIQDDAEFIPHPRPSTRFGIDGQWVGATHSNSYFFVSIDPGEHSVCMAWQGSVGAGAQRKEFALHLTAEAGQDYYFAAHDIFTGAAVGPGGRPDEGPFPVFKPLDHDRAMLLMSQYAYATSTPKK